MIIGLKSSLIPLLAIMAAVAFTSPVSGQQAIPCPSPYVVDGDTIYCGKLRVRLYAIDAPEMHGCPKGKRCAPGDAAASRAYLQTLAEGGIVCRHLKFDSYGRSVADCSSNQAKSLSCAMVAAGHAVERYGKLNCE